MYLRSNSHALEQFVDLLITELLAKRSEHVTQLANTNVTCAFLVKHLEATNELLCR